MAKKIIKSNELEKHSSLADRVKVGADVARPIHVVPSDGGVVNKKVIHAQQQAEAIIAEAKAEAQQIKAEADRLLQEVEHVRAQAREEGLQDGREEGLARATELATKLMQMKEKFTVSVEGEIIRLVMMSTEKVIGKLAEQHRDVICEIVRLAIKASIGDNIVVRVHPEDLKSVTEAESSFKDLLDRTKRLLFKEDETISRAGCIVETEVGTIDAQLETQLKAIQKALDL